MASSSGFNDLDPYLAGKPMTYFLHSSMTKEKLEAFLERHGASQACKDAAKSNLAAMYVRLLQEQEEELKKPVPARRAKKTAGQNAVTPVQSEKEINYGDAVMNDNTHGSQREEEETMKGFSSQSDNTTFANGSLRKEVLVEGTVTETTM